jgi:glycosyltransferase involved in cell wall biosynthesis
MRLLLIAPTCQAGGHHPIHVNAILAEALRRRWHVDLVTAPGDLEHSMGAEILQAVEQTSGRIIYSQFTKVPVNGPLSWAQGQWRRWKSVRTAWKKARRQAAYDVVFVMDGDGWYVPSLLLGTPVDGAPLVTIMLRLRYHWNASMGNGVIDAGSVIQRTVFERYLRLRWAAAVCVMEARLWETCHNDPRPWFRKVRYVPDFGQAPPLINKSEARRRLGLPAEARIVACVGGLNERKNLWTLFEALSHPACPSDICAVLVGQVAPELDASLRNGLPNVLLQQGRLFLFNGIYDAERLGAALSAADCAWLCYRRHLGSSGFLWEAAQAGLPILGCPAGEIAHQVETLRLGLTVADQDPAAIARALDRATRHSEEAEHWRRNCLLAGRSHTRAAFGHAVCQVIEESREST